MSGFVKQDGTNIVDETGKVLQLKGVGIGGWLLLEGYMIQSFKELDRPRRIKEYISSHLGDEYYQHFLNTWVQEFFTEKDIIEIKQCGFNSIRIPIDYAFLFEPSDTIVDLHCHVENFTLLDYIIHLCEQHHLYVVLDLHAAPGGQTGTNIDNSEHDSPMLFQNTLYQEQTIYIWNTIAKRYKHKTIIAAYDLLNEPLPNWNSQYNHLLIPLYEKIIRSIRTVDPNHMITIEGLHWSTDWSCFTSNMDSNILLQFHKYWSNPDTESIQEYLTKRQKLQTPIYMGEGGENNLLWYSSVFKLYDEWNISYCFWTYKKMNAHNSIMSFQSPHNWDLFLEQTLPPDQMKTCLDELLTNISFERSTCNKAVSNHILRTNHFHLNGYIFDYKDTPNMVREHSSFRGSEGYRILTKDQTVITPNFKQYGGEDVNEADYLYLYLSKMQEVSYSLFSKGHIRVTLHTLNDVTCDIRVNNECFKDVKTIEYQTTVDHTVVTIIANKETVLDTVEIEYIKKV